MSVLAFITYKFSWLRFTLHPSMLNSYFLLFILLLAAQGLLVYQLVA